MALKTLGTSTTSSLSAVQWNPAPAGMSSSDLAAFNALVKANYLAAQEDTGGRNSGYQPPYASREGRIYIPGRGYLQLFPGDWLAVDSTTGWPFVLSQSAVAHGPYTHS
jgi:hypothetical protein